jgi:hypothetical protein
MGNALDTLANLSAIAAKILFFFYQVVSGSWVEFADR